MQKILAFLILSAATVAPTNAFAASTPLVGPAWSETRWENVNLGEPLAAVYARLGDPILANKTADGLVHFAYLKDRGAAILSVFARRGRIEGIKITPIRGKTVTLTDFQGVSPGDPRNKLITLEGPPERLERADGNPFDAYVRHGTTWVYEDQHETVGDIGVSAPDADLDTLSSQPIPQTHAATSFSDAFIDLATNEYEGVGTEYAYISTQRCGGEGHWQRTKVSLERRDNKVYDVLDAQCTPGTQTRQFFFDITSFFGTP